MIHCIRSRTRRSSALLLVLALASGVATADTDAGRPLDPRSGEVPSTTATTSPHHLEHRLLRDIEAGVERVEPWLERYGYGAVFAAVGVEGFGVPAPGQTILEAASAASASAKGRLRIGWVLATAFVAAFLGASLGYLIGRIGGRRLLARLHIDGRHVEKIEGQFDRYGGLLILFARFFDGPRQLHGIAAGVLGMPWVRFTLFNLAGAALWAGFWGLGVYYLDLHLDQVVALIRLVNPWIAALTGIGLVMAVVGFWLQYSRAKKGR